MKKLIILAVAILFCSSLYAQVHTSYLWHLHQPVYWSEQSQWSPPKYQNTWESHYLKTHGGNIYPDGKAHPLNDLQEIFSKDDRKAVYQYRAKDAVETLLGFPEAGAQVNYSGALIENVNSLAQENQWGYNPGWQNNYITARNWETTGGNPRMDIVGFTFHHLTSPLVSDNMLKKDLQAYKYIYQQTFGTQPDFSKGYWPAECSFSERVIKVLVEEGYEWSVIANGHLARTLADYPLSFGTAGCNMDPPNRADKVATTGNNWWSGQIDGRGGTFAAPYCYQAHKAQYVDPLTGEVFKITVVPMDDVLSYKNGYAMMGTSEIDQYIAPYEDPSHPGMVLLAHDGDNAWGGGYDYYHNSVPQFAQACANKGYVPSTIQQFLDDHPVPENDLVHVEDGSWVNAANDWGHPQFINWLWPMYTGDYQFNPDGWTEDARNWAVIVAAENRVQMAEDLSVPLSIADIVSPTNSSPLAAKAWHHLLPGCASDFMYYGTALDMEVKQTLAANLAVGFADQVISANPGIDDTRPTVFIPQRYPYNPGGIGFGPNYNYQQHQNSSDFYVWTFAYDVSGLQSIVLKYRLDEDGVNPIESNENEIYNGGSGVGEWVSIPMTSRVFPTGNVTNNPDIDFFILPEYIANEYYAEITGLSEKLADYFVEAVDNHGNITRSAIQHVYVGQETSGGGGSSSVSWVPEEPGNNDMITIIVENATQGAKLHWGVNGFDTPDVVYWPQGTVLFNGTGPAVETTFVGPNSQNQLVVQIGPFNNPEQAVLSLNFVIHYNDDTWDNNNGNDYNISFGPGGNDIVQWQPASPSLNEMITITVNQTAVGGKLHWGVNGWASPNTVYWPQGSYLFNGTGPAVQSPMSGPNSNNQLTIQIGPFNRPQQDVNTVDFVISFNNGTWNNNNGQDYHISINPAVTTGQLGGLVTALPLGEVLTGATISLSDGINTYTTTSTELTGTDINYTIADINPGFYTVTCEANGYYPYQMSNVIILNSGDLTILNFEMEPLTFPLPPGWNVVSTPDIHTISIPADINPVINGNPVHRGDYFGVFYKDDNLVEKCGGLVEWRNETTALTAFGNDVSTPAKDGFFNGENLVWKFFSQQEQTEYPVNVTYNQQMPDADGKFHSNGMSQLTSLEAYSVIYQIIPVHAGWSGISSFVNPFIKPVDSIFSPFGENFVILSDANGFYYPAAGTNTIGDWNYSHGYQIKVTQDFDIFFEGIPVDDPTIYLQEGWNLVPVLTSCGGLTNEIFGNINGLKVIKEVAGPGLYWPDQGIVTLNYIQPGKSYWVMVTNPETVTYPACQSGTYIPPTNDIPANNTPWNDVLRTATSHSIALPVFVLNQSGIVSGDILGAFTPGGLCAGMLEIKNLASSQALTVFGDDGITQEKDGFETGERFIFKLFRPQVNKEITVDVVFDQTQPQMGTFVTQGLSSIGSILLNTNNIPEVLHCNPEIFPNPANGFFILKMNYWPDKLKLELFNSTGQVMKVFENIENQDDYIKEYDIREFPKGIYFLKLVGSEFRAIQKLVVN